jgi:methylenetetrahydrofolate reductase (NADPH)
VNPFGRRRSLGDTERAALGRVVEDAKLELIPLRNLDAQLPFLPAGAVVSVTASPAKGIEATVELSGRLRARGFRVTPHLSARMIRDTGHLRDVLSRVADAGIDRAFIVGGDAEEPGEFLDGLSLLRAMAEIGHGLTELGVPCYPQGHPTIPDEALLTALADKAPFVQYVTTQLCFDPVAIRTWVAARRADGIALPVVVGIPGVTEPQKLLAISARIGVKDTKRFVLKNARFVARMVRSGGFYQPRDLLEDLAPVFADPAADVHGIHVYTFNQIEATESWRRRYLATLGLAASA